MRTLRERFLAKVERPADTECWIWTGGKHPRGYGVMYLGPGRQKNVYAHRVAYELFVGPIPDGLEIDHLCRNTSCVNPAHLEAVTHRENLHRSDLIAAKVAQVVCKRGHALSGPNLYITPRGTRRCRACRRILQRGYNRKAVAA